MIQHDLAQLSTTPRDLRKFAFLVGGVFLLLGAWFVYRGRPWWPWFVTPGGLLLAFGMVAPRALRPVYLAWMAMAFSLGLIVTTVVLTLFYYGVITPIAWLGRIVGKDFLSERMNPAASSYWLAHHRSAPGQPQDYERQY